MVISAVKKSKIAKVLVYMDPNSNKVGSRWMDKDVIDLDIDRYNGVLLSQK